MQFSPKRKKSNVHKKNNITCCSAVHRCSINMTISNVANDNSYLFLSTNHELSYHEQNAANCFG